jgi:hypothetical protein
MADWQLIASRLYASLKAMPCRCTRGGWDRIKGEYPITKRCSRCIAIELYEQAAGIGT